MKPEPEELLSSAEGSISKPPFTGGEAGSTSKTYLSGPSIYDRLEDDEQIHYLLVNEWFGLIIKEVGGSSKQSYAPTGELHGLAAVTDREIYFVIGQEGGDEVAFINLNDITDTTVERGTLSTKIYFETENKKYIFRVRERDSSDPDEVVNYIRKQSTKKDFTRSDTPSSSQQGVDDDQSGEPTDPEFITDAGQLSQDAASKLQIVAQTFSDVDPHAGEFNESIDGLEEAKKGLDSLSEEPGVRSEPILSTVERIDSWLKPLRIVRTALTDGIRKQLLIERGGNVSADSLEDTFKSLIDANSMAKAFGWPNSELQKVHKQLNEEIDDASLSGASESAFNWQGSSSAESQELNNESYPTEQSSSDGISDETGTLAGIPTETQSEISNLSEITDEVAAQIKTDLDSCETDSDQKGTGSSIDTDDKGENKTSEKPSRNDLIKEIERVSTELEKRPSLTEFDNHKSIDGDYVYDYFDSWHDAITAADVTELSTSDLLDELGRLRDELGYPPISTHINKHSKFTTYDYQREFGSVINALEAADIELESFISQRLEEAVSNTDGELTMSDFTETLPYSGGVVYKFYDSWEDAVNSVTDSTAKEADSEIQQNELTEWYELVRNLKNVCDIVIEVASETDGTETTDPLVQWYDNVKAFYNGGSNIETGYGTQQAEENPFSVEDYRTEFGNGERTTEFEYVSAKLISPSVKRLLRPHTELELDDIYLPADPETDEKFPIIVESAAELQRAKNMLSNLPTNPGPADVDDSESNKEGGSGETTSGHTPEPEIESVPGVTATIATSLQEAGYGTREDLQEASTEELEKVENVTHQDVLRIKVNVGG